MVEVSRKTAALFQEILKWKISKVSSLNVYSYRAVRINRKVLVKVLCITILLILSGDIEFNMCVFHFLLVRSTVETFNVLIHHPLYACITIILNSSTLLLQ